MKLTVGQMLFSAVDATALVVIRCPDGEVTVTCGGEDMLVRTPAPAAFPKAAEGGGGALLGKRYTVEGVNIELLCTQGGTFPLAVDGASVAQQAAKPLPASD